MREIRPYHQPDYTSLLTTIDAVCTDSPYMLTPRFEPTPPWEHALRDPHCARHLLLVAEDNGQIVGWCRLFPLALCNGSTPQLELGIGLLPEARGRGIGTGLAERAIHWAQDRGIDQLVLTVNSKNFRAIHFFKQLGFAITCKRSDSQVEMIAPLRQGES